MLNENSRPRTPDAYHSPLMLDNQIINHPRQDLRYHTLPVKRKNEILQKTTVTRYPELDRLTQFTTELKFEVTKNSRIGSLNPHLISTSTHIKQRTFHSPFVETNVQFCSTGESLFEHQRKCNFLQPQLCFETQNYFPKPMISFSVLLVFSWL